MSPDDFRVLRNKHCDKSRWMQLPRNVLIGHAALEQVGSVCSNLRLGKSGLIISGPHTWKIAGERVSEVLSEYAMTRYSVEHISTEVLEEAEKAGKNADFVIGIGGGKVIDTAKITAYNLTIPFISIPTAASHDGIASARASIPQGEDNASVAAEPPMAIIADTGIIAQAPHRLLASGCADIISNYTAILDWELSHRLRDEPVSEYAVALSRMTAEILVKNARCIRPNHEESAWMVTKALVSSGVAMSIAGSSRPASGGEHKFGHALERIIPGKVLHGEACGLGSVMTMYLHGGDWQRIRSALKTIGAPTTPAEAGIPDEAAVQALLTSKNIRPERFTILDMGLTKESAERLVQRLYEVDDKDD